MRTAIIGTGIAGLGAAHVLHRAGHEFTCFEQESEPGGHAHTVDAPAANGTQPVDVGFIVYNEPNYPLFTRLLRELQVDTQPSDMSFGCYNEVTGSAYSSRGWRGLFATPRNAVSPSHYRMILDILRFNKLARKQLAGPSDPDLFLGDFLKRHGFSRVFINQYISPMSAAIWSAPPGATLAFPAETFFRFFKNHGLLSTAPDVPWRTVTGGSRSYVQALTRPFADQIRCNTTVTRVHREAAGVRLQFAASADAVFDRVLLAVHADQALAMLADPSADEQELLALYPYQPNRVVLHNDTGVLPPSRKAWASWNVRMTAAALQGEGPLTMTYDMNRLQSIPGDEQYCVSLNPDQTWLDRQTSTEQSATQVFFDSVFAHPAYHGQSFARQPELSRLNSGRNTFYCGAWFGYGFHEDGLRSGVEAAAAMGVEWH